MPASFALSRTPRVAASAFFLTAGVGIGGWAASLPALSAEVGLDKRELGIALLCFALGAIATMTNVGRLIPRFGTAFMCLAGAVTFGVILAAAPHSGNLMVFSLLAFIGGGGFGALDVAMNTEAAFLERESGQHIMSSFHAIFSVGSLSGAVVCGQILRAGGDVALCLTAVGVCTIGLSVFARLWAELPVVPEAEAGDRVIPVLEQGKKRHLLLLGTVGFLALMAEGAIMDWSAIYMVETIGTAESTAAFGFAVFAGLMAVGRFVGDAATNALGPEKLFRASALAVCAGMAAMLSVNNVATVFAALAVCGLGMANVVPAIFSAAGRIGGEAAGSAMSRVTTMGYAGLLIGPPFLGFLAETTSLGASLWVVVGMLLAIAAGARLLRTA